MTTHLVTAVGLLVGLVLFGRPRTVRIGGRRDLDGPTGTVRVVIPARNEAASIGNLLQDLAGQVGDGWEVVVVDDGSEDTTAEIARQFDFVTVVTAPPRPPAWVGKPWACTVGVHHLSGEPAEELVFLDADVRLAPGALAAVVGERRAHGGVLSVQPFHRAGSAVEELSALFNVVSFMGIGAASAHPHGLFGPVIACRRDDYHAVGGHGSVRSAVIEDVELALAFDAAGIPVAVRAGGQAVSFRMYPLGLRSIVDGWSKNMALGARSVPAWRTLGVAWWVTSLVSASAIPATWWANPSWTAAAVYVAAVLVLRSVLRRVGSFRWWVAAAFPVVTAFFVAVFVRSLWWTYVRRSVAWRGRVIDLRAASRPVGDLTSVDGERP